jgi:hypothetical protein
MSSGCGARALCEERTSVLGKHSKGIGTDHTESNAQLPNPHSPATLIFLYIQL